MGPRFLLLTAGLCTISAGAASLDNLIRKTGPLETETLELRGLDTAHQYSLLYSLDALSGMTAGARVEVELRQGKQVLASKTLHAGDRDYYTQFRVPRAGSATLAIRAGQLAGNRTVQVNRWPLTAAVKSLPDRQWQDAQPIALGQTVFASGDEAEYLPLPGTPRKEIADRSGAADWYRVDFDGPPKLVFFQVELTDRDQIPVDVRVYRATAGKLDEFYDGEDPVTLPHEVQALPGNAFTPRILKEKGTYYLAVRAPYPEYRLRTRVYDPPPYSDPRIAVRTALDYILAAGDSWHVNTPRRGGVFDRVDSVHQETSLCVGCHTTHFPLRAALYAARNGYPVNQRRQLQFLTERFYNNPRPFYGFEQEGAVWARVISAPANVLGRMDHLIDLFEQQITGEHRTGYKEGIAKYLDLYYSGRDKLPADETNGNTPLVSAHEIAWYAWTVTKDPRMGEFIAGGEVKNMIDLCYQTQALADIDPTRYRAQIQKNAERILSLQRPDGQWSMKFEANQPEVEFQTGHALWALQAAGIPVDHPQVAKAIDYLMKRQQAFGGWMDPLQSFENFRTPFRETQMAILALSAYFPIAGRPKGWNSPKLETLSADPAVLLDQLDQVWDAPSPEVLRQIQAAADSPDALIREAAVEALGRIGQPDSVPAKLLGDPSKMVQRTAAWAWRQCYSRHTDAPTAPLIAALSSKDERTRWGATRVFAQHFAGLARRPEFAPPLLHLVDDSSVAVRMNAVKAAWQFWFWSADLSTKNRIEDSLLAAMAQPQSEWVETNLRAAIYNLADENIRYLYNNWVALLGQPADRERATRGRLAVEGAPGRQVRRHSADRSRRREEGVAPLAHGISAAPRRRVRCRGGPGQQARRAGLQPHRQRYRADRLLRGERQPDGLGDRPAARVDGCRYAPPGRQGRPAGARQPLRRREPHRRTDGRLGEAADRLAGRHAGGRRYRAHAASRAAPDERSGRRADRRAAAAGQAGRSLLPRLRAADPRKARQGRLRLRALPRHPHAVRRHLLDGDARGGYRRP